MPPPEAAGDALVEEEELPVRVVPVRMAAALAALDRAW